MVETKEEIAGFMHGRLLEVAREFIFREVPQLKWTSNELAVIERVFTNSSKRVFFIHNRLPANMIGVLMAMYSRIKNIRGIRGTFVDQMLPSILASQLVECQQVFDGEAEKFLKERNLKRLDDFVNYRNDAYPQDRPAQLFAEFVQHMGSPEFAARLGQGEKLKRFLGNWLDKYGHNSIARPTMFYICFEWISILAAKSIEWGRPGVGWIELSTRYVDMNGAEVYPIEKELALYGVSESLVRRIVQQGFALYQQLQGHSEANATGPFTEFLRRHYAGLVPANQLEAGVFGETCDVLGNLLPCNTLALMGAGVSGEALQELVKHLKMDATPENEAIIELMQQEAVKVGADMFVRHTSVSEWQETGWTYLANEQHSFESFLTNRFDTEKTLFWIFKNKYGFEHCQSWDDVIADLKKINTSEHRGGYDKLFREFETVSANFIGMMSFRGWRDLQRMGFCTHRRGLVTPTNGFYQYDKPSPVELQAAFGAIHSSDLELYRELRLHDVPGVLRQYPMSMGNLIPFFVGANLRQWEFANWQRSKPSVNHEVRQIFLKIESALRQMYPWWSEISRADTTSGYIFARGSEIPLKGE